MNETSTTESLLLFSSRSDWFMRLEILMWRIKSKPLKKTLPRKTIATL